MYLTEFLNIVFLFLYFFLILFFFDFVVFDFVAFVGFVGFRLNHTALSVRVFSRGEQSAARGLVAFC